MNDKTQTLVFFMLTFYLSGCCSGMIWIRDEQQPSIIDKDCMAKEKMPQSQPDVFFYFEGIGENGRLSKAIDMANEEIRKSLFASVFTELGGRRNLSESDQWIRECKINVYGFKSVSECTVVETSHWKHQCKKKLSTTKTNHKFILVKRLSKLEYRRVVLKVQNCLSRHFD